MLTGAVRGCRRQGTEFAPWALGDGAPEDYSGDQARKAEGLTILECMRFALFLFLINKLTVSIRLLTKMQIALDLFAWPALGDSGSVSEAQAS